MPYAFALVLGSLGMADIVPWLFVQRRVIIAGICNSPCGRCMWRVTRKRRPYHDSASLKARLVNDVEGGVVDLSSVEEAAAAAEEEMTGEGEEAAEEEEEEEETRDISDALRHEFIARTTEGIRIESTASDTSRHNSGLAGTNEKVKHKLLPKRIQRASDTVGTSNPNNTRNNTRTFQWESNMDAEADQRTYSTNVDLKYSLDIAAAMQLAHNPAMQQLDSCVFVAYQRSTFRLLRCRLGVTEEQYAASFDGDVAKMSQNFSEGKSGSFFYFSVDKRYIVKRCSRSEHRFLQSILGKYTNYICSRPNTLICKFYGLYSIRMYGHSEYFLVMNNAFFVPEYEGLHYAIEEKYDLKGTVPIKHWWESSKKEDKGATMCDTDLKQPVRIPYEDSVMLMTQLKRDAAFLKSMGIMDYSLLMGVHYQFSALPVNDPFLQPPPSPSHTMRHRRGGSYNNELNAPSANFTTTTTTTTTMQTVREQEGKGCVFQSGV